MATFENVVLTPNAASVPAGSVVTITLTGTATVSTSQTMTVQVGLTTADGQTGTASVPVTITGSSQVAATITGATDNLNHTWTVAGDSKSVSTTA